MSRKEDLYINADVLVIGGGLGGCFAAIKAAEEGAKVVLFEKAYLRRSGQMGTGISCMLLIHPDYNISYREFAKLNIESAAGIADEDVAYEFAKDTYDRIMDLEKYGLKVRDDDGEFFFVPAFDVAPGMLRIQTPERGAWHELKPVLARKVESFENIIVLNRTTAISILTAEGEAGTEVVGGLGMETRTGRFVVCNAKSVIVTSGDSNRLQRHRDTMYAPSKFISCGPPTNCGDGLAMGYRAGADIVNMEFGCLGITWKNFDHDGVGQALLSGTVRTGIPGQLSGFMEQPEFYLKTHKAAFNSVGPLYADLSESAGWPEEEGKFKRALWALDSEATSTGYFAWMAERGEDFKKGPIEIDWPPLMGVHNNQGGIYIDVNAASSLPGLYVGGDMAAGGWRQSSGGGFVFGARAGRSAAQYAKNKHLGKISAKQLEAEKKRITQSLEILPEAGYNWIELEDKIRQIAEEYGPPFTNDAKLKQGISHLERLKERYLPLLYAKDSRDMLRVNEVHSIYQTVELFLRGALFRKESRSTKLSILYKTDYPERNDAEWLKHTLIQNRFGEPVISTKEVRRLGD